MSHSVVDGRLKMFHYVVDCHAAVIVRPPPPVEVLVRILYYLFVFAVQNKIARNMVRRSIYNPQKAFISFDKRQFKTDKEPDKFWKNLQVAPFWAKKLLKVTFSH